MRRNVLITAASRRVPLVQAFRKALADTGGGRILDTDVNAMSPAVHVADTAFQVPLATDPGCVEVLESICRDHHVSLLVPTIDDELEVLGDAREQLQATGVSVAAALEFHGPVNIQCRTLRGIPTVFEINPRFSGGIPLTIAAGADFPRMLVDLAHGRTLAPRIGHFRDGLWMTSYEAGIFLPSYRAGVLPQTAAAIQEVA
jgi:PylC-like, N-terminal domain/ATP-grasp in the biosynthetic pathway with Ter operon